MKEKIIAGEETVGSQVQNIVHMIFEHSKISMGEEVCHIRAKAITESVSGREIVSVP